MLIEFSVGNFWSFKELQTLQMQAAKIVSKFPKVDEENVFAAGKNMNLLKSKAIYGANASGKSNLVRAFTAMRQIVRDNVSNEQVLEQYIFPFKFNEETLNQPTFFQVVFIHKEVMYRYGFEATKKEVTAEWLFGKPLGKSRARERYYFIREGKELEVNTNHFKEGAGFVKDGGQATPYFRENSLFLTVVAAFNGKLSLELQRSIVNKISIVFGLEDSEQYLMSKSIEYFAEQEIYRKKITDLLKSIDIGIQAIEVVDIDNIALDGFSKEKDMLKMAKSNGYKRKDLAIFRNIFDDSGKAVGQSPVLLSSQEAEGTKKMFALSSLLLLVLEKGGLLVVDEFDGRFHPKLAKKIVELFHSKSSNTNNAQLVFVTHDPTMMNAKLLRRDQICFAEKDKFGATDIYSLAEFKGVRNDASFEKDYLLGKYGATPNNLNVLKHSFTVPPAHA